MLIANLRLGLVFVTAPCRIVYVTDDKDSFGFAYGTLPVTPIGARRTFTSYEGLTVKSALTLVALSRPPNLLVRLGGLIFGLRPVLLRNFVRQAVGRRRRSVELSPVVVLLVAVVVLFWVLSMALFVRLDKKWSIKRGRTIGTEGPFAASSLTQAAVSPDSASVIAEGAIRQIGGHQIAIPDDRTVIGWIGSLWTNLPKRGEYELLVSHSLQDDGLVLFACRSRPRNSLQFIGPGISQRLAEQLACHSRLDRPQGRPLEGDRATRSRRSDLASLARLHRRVIGASAGVADTADAPEIQRL